MDRGNYVEISENALLLPFLLSVNSQIAELENLQQKISD